MLQDLVDDIRVRHIGDHPQPPAAVRAHRDLDPEHASQPLRPGQRRLRRSSEFSLLIVVCHRTAVVVLMAAMARGAAGARCDASVGSSRGVPIGSVLSQVEAPWDRLIPNYPMQTEMLDETFAEVFDVFELATRVVGNFAVIALLLSATGLFGLAAFMAQSRTKEIGIRKVVGAGMCQIVRLLVWQFSRPVLVSLLFALPLAYFASNIYLDFFADRIGPPAGIVAGSGVAAVLFSWLIVGIQAWRVARESPIRALRYE